MNSNLKTRRATSERGSALLIVFVFAAFVAIMLYREMPVAAFEAQRQKEQMLIDRGEQYKRAVKLFYRKFGMYPASIEQLEDTNRMRFLRQRYKDPFTGKDDWRLLHMGPGGMLIDSKVNPLKPVNQNQNASGFGPNSGPPAGSNATAGSSFSSSSSPPGGSWSAFDSDQSGVVVAPVLKRRPAISANGSTLSGNPAVTGASQSPESADAGLLEEAMQSGASTQPGQPAQATSGGAAQSNPGGAAQPGQLQTPNPQAPSGSQSSAAVSPDQSGSAAPTANSMDSIRHMLTSPGGQAQISSGSGFGSSSFKVMSGGFAGVASKAKGHSIKVVNDQVDYSLWEFYYDPNKELQRNMPSLGSSFANAPPGAVNPGSRIVTAPAPSAAAPANPSPLNQNQLEPEAPNPENSPPTDAEPTPEEPNPEPPQ